MYCSNCGAQNAETARFCEKCGTGLAATAPPAGQPETRMRGVDITPTASTHPVTDKNPGIAVVLSFVLAGAGQFYNGDHKKGALMLIGGIVGGAVTGGLIYLAAWIWSMIDAYFVASGKGKRW